MDKDNFTWYRCKHRYTQEEMLEMYNDIKSVVGDIDFDGFLSQIEEACIKRGSDSSDGSYSKSWENVR